MGPLPDAFSQGFTAPHPSPGGMFGGGKFGWAQAISAALNGYLAAMPGPSQAVGLAGLKAMDERRQMAMEEQMYEHRQDLQMQREMAMLPYQLRMKLMYPDSPEAQTAAAAGMAPGGPEWQKHFAALSNIAEHPVVNAGPYGPVLYDQVAGAASAKPLSDADIDRMSQGGQTPPASGGFPNGPYPPIGPYNRY